MPGKRNLARDLAAHAAHQLELRQRIYHDLTSQLPRRDVVLVGKDAIIAYLNDVLHVRRPSGRRISYRMLKRWRVRYACPVLPGYKHFGCTTNASVSTTFALTAWVLSNFANDSRLMVIATYAPAAGSFTPCEALTTGLAA